MGVSEDKDAPAMSAHLKNSVAHIFLTQAQHPRAHVFTPAEAQSYFGGKPVEIIGSLPKALQKAMQMAGAQDVVLVTGSIFLVAEAIDCLAIAGTTSS
jgi:dihydrofolate synthase/folylpolyglutamate synthase